MMFYCYGKEMFCDHPIDCNLCKFANDDGGVEIPDDLADIEEIENIIRENKPADPEPSISQETIDFFARIFSDGIKEGLKADHDVIAEVTLPEDPVARRRILGCIANDGEPEKPDKRTSFLDEVAKIVNGERQDMYGSPEDSFKLIAEFWSSYLGMVITPMHVAMMMVLLKVASQAGKPKDDNLVDIAGYAACAAGLERW